MRHSTLMVWLVLFSCTWFSGCNSATDSENGPATPPVTGVAESGTATLEICFNSNRDDLEIEVACEPEMTVLAILEKAQAMGEFDFESTGSGASAFVKSIGGIENLAARGNNWTYRVNSEVGNRSCGVYSVNPGDRVLWAFGDYP